MAKFEKPAPEPTKKKTTRGRSKKQKRREEVLTRYEKEIARIEAMKKAPKTKGTLIKAAESEKEKEMAEIDKCRNAVRLRGRPFHVWIKEDV